VGSDVAPLAVLVARAKTTNFDVAVLRTTSETFCSWVEERRIDDLENAGSFLHDVSKEDFASRREDLADWIPELPRIEHWFRRRAVLQLAAIRRRIGDFSDEKARQFLMLCLASVIRNASNADPVPV